MMPAITDAFPHEFDSTWRGFGGVHGGLVVASMVHAATAESGAVPVSASAHFTRPVQPGPVDVRVDVEHGGRTPSVRTAMGDSANGMVRLTRTPGLTTWPPVPRDFDNVDPESLSPLEIPVDFVPFSQYLDIRPVNVARPFAGGDVPEFEVWIRLVTPIAFTTAERAAVLLDALPPGLFATFTTPVPIPTVEFTAHFSPVSTSRTDWHHLRNRTVWATGDLCVDESELFTSSGHLVGQARQVRRILTS
ncbi:MAG: thioesterase family protein [Rhodococcus sp. (in: high G+C Gram-positive bacteria)]|uniref:acyl-CoA thioesterase n=1 Tax=Rhodococcus sp. TaxID=1831 RepID=UPI003BAEE63A